MVVPDVHRALQEKFGWNAANLTTGELVHFVAHVDDVRVLQRDKTNFQWVADHLVDFLPVSFHSIILNEIKCLVNTVNEVE